MIRILISGGGTKEYIDGVRYLSNFSTGNTAISLAQALFDAGHEVKLVLSETAAYKEFHFPVVRFSDFKSLQNILQTELKNHYDIYISAAAISDYSLHGIEVEGQFYSVNKNSKMSSDYDEMHLVLKKNPKLISLVSEYSKNKKIINIAFKLTNHANSEQIKASVNKLFESSHCSLLVHNDKKQIDENDHRFYIYDKNSQIIKCENKLELAKFLNSYIQNTFQPEVSYDSMP